MASGGRSGRCKAVSRVRTPNQLSQTRMESSLNQRRMALIKAAAMASLVTARRAELYP